MTDAPPIEIRRFASEAEMSQLLTLRHEVFCVEQGVPARE